MKLLYLRFIFLIGVLSICLAYPEENGTTQGSSTVEISLPDVRSTHMDSFQPKDSSALSDTLPIFERRREGSSSNRKITITDKIIDLTCLVTKYGVWRGCSKYCFTKRKIFYQKGNRRACPGFEFEKCNTNKRCRTKKIIPRRDESKL